MAARVQKAEPLTIGADLVKARGLPGRFSITRDVLQAVAQVRVTGARLVWDRDRNWRPGVHVDGEAVRVSGDPMAGCPVLGYGVAAVDHGESPIPVDFTAAFTDADLSTLVGSGFFSRRADVDLSALVGAVLDVPGTAAVVEESVGEESAKVSVQKVDFDGPEVNGLATLVAVRVPAEGPGDA